MQLQLGRSLDRTEGKPRCRGHLGGIDLMAEPTLLRLEKLDVIGIHHVSDTQRCVYCTPEQKRTGEVLTGCWREITRFDYLCFGPRACMGICLLLTVKFHKTVAPLVTIRKVFLDIKRLHYVTICQMNNQNKTKKHQEM